nr:hypothetical protein [Tanacetum cinerariifolium]
MTFIKAARTMLADSLLPIPSWDEAANTACYVQHRDNGDHEGKNQAGTLIDIHISVGKFSIILQFLINDVDITSDTIITFSASHRRNTTNTLAAALPPPSPPTTIPSPQPRAATPTSVSPPSQPPRHPAATTITTIMGCLFDSTRKNLRANGPTSLGFDMYKVDSYNRHRKGHFAKECGSFKDSRRNGSAERQRKNVPVETSTSNALVSQCDGVGSYDWSFKQRMSLPIIHLWPSHLQALLLIMRPSAPIIEDWVSDSEDESETKTPQIVPTATPKPASLKPTSNGKRRNIKACFVCKSLDHLIKDYDYHEKKMAQPTARHHAHRGTHKHYAQMTHQTPQKHMVPPVVLTQSKSIPVTDVRPVSTAVPKTRVTTPKQVNPIVTKPNLSKRRHITHSPSPTANNSPPRVTTIQVSNGLGPKANLTILFLVQGNPQHALKDKGVIDSGCSRYMKGNMSYLSNFEELNGGYVAFGGNPKDVSYKMCDKKNSVLFTDTKRLVFPLDFKLPDASQVLFTVPRENNMNNHRRLGHINFKTMNKLVKGNLVRGLPTKVFENDNTCVACKKGKQHRASCKTKPVSSVNQPLYRLHMDLFRPTFVRSQNKKTYCLVVIDYYSRFTWVFFLATKDKTSHILKTFITGLESQLSLKVKVIRSDNGTKFKNNDLNQLKEIKSEFSVPRTPQQNGIAERKNRILIENRVLVTKPHNKTPHDLLHGRTPSIGFMRPFGCPVIILNTLDSLGKFDRKVDEGFLVGYSVSRKAFSVFNNRTRIVEETLHVNFLENKPNVAGIGPTWLFDIDSLTKTMNYQSVTTGNQSNLSAGFQDKFDAEKAGEEIDQQYVLFPVCAAGPSNAIASPTHGKSSFNDASQLPDDPDMPEIKDITYSDDEDDVGAEADFNNLETTITVSPIPTTRVHKDHLVTQIIGDLSLATQTRCDTRQFPNCK